MPAKAATKAKVQTVSKAAKAATAVRSMTGYGRTMVEQDSQRVTAEIRAVNGRYLKLGVKILGRYGTLEDRIKTMVSEAGIKRGSVDVSLFFERGGEEGSFALNATAVKRYVEQARALAKKNKLKPDISIAALLPLPGVIKRDETEEDIEAIWTVARQALEAAIVDFNQMREREGAAILADISGQLAQITLHRSMIQAAAPEVLKVAIQRFRERIAKMLEQSGITAPMNPDALEREVVMMTDRMDISEEIARLQSHLEQMSSTLSGGGETGKKLDFLTQELFRETNTIGSKAQDERIVHRVVEMKGLIEKIREQVQNLE